MAGYGVIIFIMFAISLLFVALYRLNTTASAQEDPSQVLLVPYTVIIWSGLGSFAAMLYQFLHRPVSQLETFKWLVARPIQGIIMGSFLYLVIAGGLLILGNQTTELRSEMAAAIGFLGGFSDRFADEMVKRATSILSQQSSSQQESSHVVKINDVP